MRTNPYPSDLTDAEWALLEPLVPPAQDLGRPRKTDLREVINAISYRNRNGCTWRALPRDFPPWRTVYNYFQQWRDDGTWTALNDALRGAARHAALAMRAKVLEVAAQAMEAAPEDLELAGGVVSVRGTPSRSMTLADVARAADNPANLPPGEDPGLEVASRWLTDATGSTFSNACHICTCEVDRATGQVRILRYVVSEDCGVMINPMVVEGQVQRRSLRLRCASPTLDGGIECHARCDTQGPRAPEACAVRSPGRAMIGDPLLVRAA